MFSRINSMGVLGLESYMVSVEADISKGMPKFELVGLPDAAVSEAKDRVRSAAVNCGFEFPHDRITVNLAPAIMKKEGTLYDLPVLMALLSASEQIGFDLSDCAFIGEISLDGLIRKIKGALPMVIRAEKSGIKRVFVPEGNARESAVVEGIEVYPVSSVSQLIAHLDGSSPVKRAVSSAFLQERTSISLPDFRDVKGQPAAKRALEIAAAGGHNILMVGPPGSGKSMLAKRLPSILPEMTFEESLETTEIYSVAGILPEGVSLITERPYRSPHHSVSPAGLAGGGITPRPGEISLAHNGVLFLDELPEFTRQSLEIMRQPIEDGVITISRANASLTYPTGAMIVCAMNPCPCGYLGHPGRKCSCTDAAVRGYLAKVSGPLLDRIDIHIEVPPVDFNKLSDTTEEESSQEIRKRVNSARAIQLERLKGSGITCNAKMTPALTRKLCVASKEGNELLERAFSNLGLSARAYDKVLRVARTVADLEGSEKIEARHIAQAVQYRRLDREVWKR